MNWWTALFAPLLRAKDLRAGLGQNKGQRDSAKKWDDDMKAEMDELQRQIDARKNDAK